MNTHTHTHTHTHTPQYGCHSLPRTDPLTDVYGMSGAQEDGKREKEESSPLSLPSPMSSQVSSPPRTPLSGRPHIHTMREVLWLLARQEPGHSGQWRGIAEPGPRKIQTGQQGGSNLTDLISGWLLCWHTLASFSCPLAPKVQGVDWLLTPRICWTCRVVRGFMGRK